MNPLAASLIRTYAPIIVGQVAAWLLLAHIALDLPTTVAFTSFVGGLLTAVYYTLARLLEERWPAAGALLGLAASPDTYSKGDPKGTDTPKQTSLEATALNAPHAASSYPVHDAEATAEIHAPLANTIVEPIFEAPAPADSTPASTGPDHRLDDPINTTTL